MPERPHVILSAAMSLDGHLDDTTPDRLMLSDEADFDRVDALRAASDAIMVGAETIRRDDPRLLVRDPERRADRVRRGLAEHPVKVTVTGAGALDPSRALLHHRRPQTRLLRRRRRSPRRPTGWPASPTPRSSRPGRSSTSPASSPI